MHIYIYSYFLLFLKINLVTLHCSYGTDTRANPWHYIYTIIYELQLLID